jgi:hypothetical protein
VIAAERERKERGRERERERERAKESQRQKSLMVVVADSSGRSVRFHGCQMPMDLFVSSVAYGLAEIGAASYSCVGATQIIIS